MSHNIITSNGFIDTNIERSNISHKYNEKTANGILYLDLSVLMFSKSQLF